MKSSLKIMKPWIFILSPTREVAHHKQKLAAIKKEDDNGHVRWSSPVNGFRRARTESENSKNHLKYLTLVSEWHRASNMAYAYNGYCEQIVAFADWWSYGFNKILDAVGDGVLTHENPMGKEAVEESKLEQLFVMKRAAYLWTRKVRKAWIEIEDWASSLWMTLEHRLTGNRTLSYRF